MCSALRNDDLAPVRSVAKAFALLDIVGARAEEWVSLGDLARHAGVPKPTAHRLAASLVSVGALERSDHGYRLGLHLFELGVGVRRTHRLHETAVPFLQDLHRATGHTVHLAVLDGSDVVYLARVRGHRAVRLPSRVGGRLPASCTGVGKALLAHSPREAAVVLSGPLPVRTGYSITVPDVLRRELAEIRRTGVALEREESTIGAACAAAPILVGTLLVAAISASGPLGRFDVAATVPLVRSTARSLGHSLAVPTVPKS